MFKSLSRAASLRHRWGQGCCLAPAGQGCNPGSPPSLLGTCSVGVSPLFGLGVFTVPGEGGRCPVSPGGGGVGPRLSPWSPLTVLGGSCHLMGWKSLASTDPTRWDGGRPFCCVGSGGGSRLSLRVSVHMSWHCWAASLPSPSTGVCEAERKPGAHCSVFFPVCLFSVSESCVLNVASNVSRCI